MIFWVHTLVYVWRQSARDFCTHGTLSVWRPVSAAWMSECEFSVWPFILEWVCNWPQECKAPDWAWGAIPSSRMTTRVCLMSGCAWPANVQVRDSQPRSAAGHGTILSMHCHPLWAWQKWTNTLPHPSPQPWQPGVPRTRGSSSKGPTHGFQDLCTVLLSGSLWQQRGVVPSLSSPWPTAHVSFTDMILLGSPGWPWNHEPFAFGVLEYWYVPAYFAQVFFLDYNREHLFSFPGPWQTLLIKPNAPHHSTSIVLFAYCAHYLDRSCNSIVQDLDPLFKISFRQTQTILWLSSLPGPWQVLLINCVTHSHTP